jgi:hypothetical protein
VMKLLIRPKYTALLGHDATPLALQVAPERC